MNPLLQALLALVLGGMALSYGIPLLIDAQVQPAQNDAGNQVAQMQAAGAAYIRNHAGDMLKPPAQGGLAVGATVAVTPAQLQADGDLAWSFIDGNVFGQKHILVITQLPPPYAAGSLDGMVYTYGGDQISDPVAIRVAQAGPAGATVVLASDAANFEGAAGGESVPVAYYQQGAAPAVTPGHIGAHILPAGYSAEAPFLNRYNTGNLDDNTLHTAQYMDGNNLEMAGPGATTGGGNIDMAGGNVNAATQLNASQRVNTPLVADPTDPAYQITMAGNSRIDSLTATNQITAQQQVNTPLVADPTDPTYQISMAGASRINGLTATGTVTAQNFFQPSDPRLKDIKGPISDACGRLSLLQGLYFNWKASGRPDMGLRADQVAAAFPDAVRQMDNGYLSVNYEVLLAPVIECLNRVTGTRSQDVP